MTYQTDWLWQQRRVEARDRRAQEHRCPVCGDFHVYESCPDYLTEDRRYERRRDV